MKKLRFLITAGPTREYLDPVRYISNASSGLMGCELAKAAAKLGHNVILVCGPVAVEKPKGVKLIDVVSAQEMFNAVKKNIKQADIIIGSAAVSDYKPIKTETNKIKSTKNSIVLKLVKTPDIMEYVGRNKSGKLVVGFALETQNELVNARKKLISKNMDFIVANSPKNISNLKASGTIIDRCGVKIKLNAVSKSIFAKRIINEALKAVKTCKAC